MPSTYGRRSVVTLLLLIVSALYPVSCKTGVPSSESTAVEPSGASRLFDGRAWPEERALRQNLYESYFNEHPVATDWFVNSPLGFNGLPLVLLLYFMEAYPDVFYDQDGQSRLGFPPHITDYDDVGNLKAPEDRRVLPLGFGWVRDPNVEATKQTSNVFFSCAGCHTNRVLVDGKMSYFFGGPSNEVEPQLYAGLLWQVGNRIFGSPASVLELSDDLPVGQRNAARVDALMAKVNIAKIYADFKKRSLRGKLKKLMAERPSFAAKEGVGEDSAKAGASDLMKELQLLTQSFGFFKEVMKGFASTYVKAHVMYHEIGYNLPFRAANPQDPDPEGRKDPGVILSEKPGQMDAFGLVQGIIALNAVRPDFSWWQFVERRYGPDALLFQGASGIGPQKYVEATKRLVGGAFGLLERRAVTAAQKRADLDVVGKWMSKNSANVDIKALWLSKDEVHANWDGNQAGGARTLASGVSSVGDPRAVDTNVHALMNHFIDDLPAPPYPFDVDIAMAERGRRLFNEGVDGAESCSSCHVPNNAKIYDVGTDMNRAMVVGKISRAALVSLTMEACEHGMQRPGEDTDRIIDGFKIAKDWCASKAADESDIYRQIDIESKTRPEGTLGYKADPLHGIWASAPYLHNGSVPTLYALLKPSHRPTKFFRGNVNYDTKEVGYVYDKPDAQYPAGESKHIAQYDTTLRGNGNGGHDMTAGWSEDQIADLIEYLKTL